MNTMIAGNMEEIINTSIAMDITKEEPCNKLFEADICASMMFHDGHSETYNLEKMPESIDGANAELCADASISEEKKMIPSEILENPSEVVEVNEIPEMDKIVQPVNTESVPSIESKEVPKKPSNSISNKRKSDNHIESNIEEKKALNMRKNIRGVINETNFDTITITAQREESERLARVQLLKKTLRQNRIQSALESLAELNSIDVDLPIEKCVVTCETPEISQQHRRIHFDSKEMKMQRISEKVEEKKMWSQYLTSQRTNMPADEKNEVVTIDSSSEDDCIILSDSDDADEDPDDDHHNSGLHVRDVLNIPNEHGKVMVNVGHVESEPDIFVAPQIAKIIKPHQIGGVRFLFDNIIESTKMFNTSSGFGCILAHSMGLGKTLQVVTFCDIFLRHTNSKTILCVMPINTIQNWVKEFNLWVPKESNNPEEIRPRTFSVFPLNDQHKTMNSRSNVIMRWAAEGGVLLIGYELFRVLALKIVKKKDGKKHENGEHKRMLDNIHMALVKPGPDLVICDEGHRIKNAHAGISIALKQIRTRRRIVLTGYPLQNNLLEYWCMVDFVRPNYLGSKTEFCNMFERPIQNGQCIDSTPGDIKLMRYRAHVLHSLLVGFVQRRSDSVLQNSLPQKLEYVILTKMTKFQRELYEAFMNEVVRKKKVPNPLKAFAVCCKIWNHPDVLYNFLKKRESDLDLDIDEQDAAPKSNIENAKLNKNKNDFNAAKPNEEGIGRTSIDNTQSLGKPNEFNAYSNEEGLHREYMNAPDNNLPTEAFYTSTFDQKGFEQRAMMNPSKEGQNTFWQDDVNAVNAQPLKPDYISRMAASTSNGIIEEKSKCSSEIVDLDTKEVQFIKSDISADLFSGKIPNVSNVKPNKTEAEPVLFNPNMKIIGKTESKTGSECISYDWALNLIKNYEPGIVSSSPKMQVFLYILEESIKLGDRVLVFSQSLLTLNLMEFFLEGLVIPESQNHWKKNVSYFRLDGSTTSLEREKLVNEFNSNTDVKLFLISTRAGSLGINLTGANRVVVFDASWNPCHDTQAVHRIYRYGQRKSCFVYRIVMDNCLEKNIYDRQVKKQGMSDRVVDECNPDAHLSIRELTNLCYDKEEENQSVEFTQPLENYTDVVMRKVITNHKSILSKEPFYHESLLIDRKEKKLSQTEKKLAKRGYEIEKKASTKPTAFLPNNIDYKVMPHRDGISNHIMSHQVHSIRKKPAVPFKSSAIRLTRWIPAEVWQRQGMSSQELKLPVDVAIPTNSTETSNIVVKAGEKVMVLNSSKGVYMQLESGKIIAIKTSAEAALQRGKLKARKLNCAEIPEKKSIAMDPIAFKKDDRCRARVERPLPDVDNDDVIVINDSINDSPENSFDMSYPNNKPRTEPIPIKNDNLPQVFRKKNEIVATETRTDKPEIQTLQTHQEFQPHTIAEPPSPRNNFVEKPRNSLFGNILNNSNYEIPPPSHSIENQHHLPAVSNNRWENKSPDIFKQSLKISNIPAPYPSVSALGIFEKNEKAQQPVNDVINVDQQYPPPPYTQTCKTSEEHIYNPSMNLNTNYYNNTLPTTAPTDDNGSMNPLYHYNNKNESNYSENLYENSDPSFSNYHQQMSKYSYGYYQPQYLPNFNNKVYDNNAYSSASSQYYLRRPTTYPTSSTNGVDVGLNYAEPQGWIKKQHLPD